MLEDITLEIYFKEIRKFPLLTAQKEQELIGQAQSGNGEAREKLINSNLRLVVNIAKQYIHCGISLSDLIAEGNIGLLYAVERFKTNKGCRFSTYATFWIRHAICHAITEKNGLIRIPAYMKKILSECKRKNEEFFKKWGHLPPVREMVKMLDLPESRKAIVEGAFFTNHAMEGIQNLSNLQDRETIEDERGDEIRRFLDKSEIEWLIELLKAIEPRRALIIKLRYGLDGCPILTLKEIADELCLTKERIRQIEKETLTLLREYLSRRSPCKMQFNFHNQRNS